MLCQGLGAFEVRGSEAIRRAFGLLANVNLDCMTQVSQNEWHGKSISVCGKPILIQVIDREDRVKEAARILGAIGGTAGRGKKKYEEIQITTEFSDIKALRNREKTRKRK